jgi:hypothetical protein
MKNMFTDFLSYITNNIFIPIMVIVLGAFLSEIFIRKQLKKSNAATKHYNQQNKSYVEGNNNIVSLKNIDNSNKITQNFSISHTNNNIKTNNEEITHKILVFIIICILAIIFGTIILYLNTLLFLFLFYNFLCVLFNLSSYEINWKLKNSKIVLCTLLNSFVLYIISIICSLIINAQNGKNYIDNVSILKNKVLLSNDPCKTVIDYVSSDILSSLYIILFFGFLLCLFIFELRSLGAVIGLRLININENRFKFVKSEFKYSIKHPIVNNAFLYIVIFILVALYNIFSELPIFN